jgi:cephalosporin hydroxylase
MQELIWSIQPNLIIETGIAHGGSLIFSASMLELNASRSTNNMSSKSASTNINGTTSTLLNRDYYIKIGSADALLKEIGIMSKDGKVKNDKIRKYNQIDRYVELLEGVLDKLPKNEIVNILDCGCGKSYLSLY